MKSGAITIGLAVVVGLAGSLLAYGILSSRPEATAVAMRTVPVVVAARDLPFGTVLGTADLALADYPADSQPAGSASDPAELVGMVNLMPLEADEPVLLAKLSGEGAGLSALVPASMRAASLALDAIAGVAGAIQPGDRVDVLSTVENGGSGGKVTTRTALEDIQVLAVGAPDDGAAETELAVTLLVGRQQAEALATAIFRGRVQLVLRNPADRQLAAARQAPARRRRSVARKPAPPTPPAAPVYVTGIRGTKVTIERAPGGLPPAAGAGPALQPVEVD